MVYAKPPNRNALYPSDMLGGQQFKPQLPTPPVNRYSRVSRCPHGTKHLIDPRTPADAVVKRASAENLAFPADSFTASTNSFTYGGRLFRFGFCGCRKERTYHGQQPGQDRAKCCHDEGANQINVVAWYSLQPLKVIVCFDIVVHYNTGSERDANKTTRRLVNFLASEYGHAFRGRTRASPCAKPSAADGCPLPNQ